MNPRFTITNAIAGGLARIERARGFLDAATLSEAWLRRMSERALLLEAHHSTHIEGTRLTLDQSARLLAGEAVPSADADDVRELLNYREAFDLVSDYLNSGDPITEGLIREIHRRLVQGVRGGSARPGEYRLAQNYVVNAATRAILYTPPPPGDVPELMRDLVAWLNTPSDIHPVLVGGIAQYQLVHIHPFLDGNGRTSRLLSTLCLYRAGYDFRRLFTLSEYYDRDRPAFYRAIRAVDLDELDLTPWLEYFVAGLDTQLAEVRERGRQAILVDVAAQEHSLNGRQAEVLRVLATEGQMTIRDIEQRFPGVARRTLQRDLKLLVVEGLVSDDEVPATDPNRRYRLTLKL
jgi:Fic family protein